MSIILKGIDMPTDRKPYGIEVIYRFEGADGLFSEKNYLSPNQAIQIPKGHGRLIDKDELLSHLSKDPLFDLVERYGVSGVIESRPTIIEAEE